MKLPNMYRLKQTFQRPFAEDIPRMVKQELVALGLEQKIRKGQKIGITVGSRGIQNILEILHIAVNYVKELGGEPYLLAAMGSHGAGLVSGQKEILDSLGITEQEFGIPVMTCADCQVLGQTSGGLPVYTLTSALTMDGILIINRVKTHTSFKGKVESGLTKKLVVGLGGPKGAQQFHGFGAEELPRLLVEIGQVVIDTLPILGALAIIENAYEETAAIYHVAREGLIERETELLAYSKTLLPSLPVDDIDLLIVEEMGKNYSGTGLDTNIIGRIRIEGVPEPSKPAIKRIAILDITEESHGNATGIGLAEFVTERIVKQIDRRATYLNCLTSTFVIRAAIPMYFVTEEKLMEAAIMSLGSTPVKQLRIVIIPNTLFLSECFVSEAVAEKLQARANIEIQTEPQQIAFDAEGNILLRIHPRKEVFI